MKVTEAEEMIRVRLSMVMRQKRITPSILARKTGISESVIRGYVQEGVVPTAGRLGGVLQALWAVWPLGKEEPQCCDSGVERHDFGGKEGAKV